MFGIANTANLSADKGFSSDTPPFVARCGAKAHRKGLNGRNFKGAVFAQVFNPKAPSGRSQLKSAATRGRRRSADNIDIMARPTGRAWRGNA